MHAFPEAKHAGLSEAKQAEWQITHVLVHEYLVYMLSLASLMSPCMAATHSEFFR